MQADINRESMRLLLRHYANFRRFGLQQRTSVTPDDSGAVLDAVLTQARACMARQQKQKQHTKAKGKPFAHSSTSHFSKDVSVLQLTARAARDMGGLRVTMCKSAKDRTSMSVTLEQAHLLCHKHRMAKEMVPIVTGVFRSHGVRRENALKNIGARTFAFNALQRTFLPREYQPPRNTAGGVLS